MSDTLDLPKISTPLEFFELLHAGVITPEGWMEFRLLPAQGGPAQTKWMQVPAWAGSGREIVIGKKTQAAHNVFYGVAIRTNNTKGGKKDCFQTHMIWADIDLRGTIYVDDDPKTISPAELDNALEMMRRDVLEKLELLGLKPRAIIKSGHGLQILFALETPMSHEWTEATNRWLAVELAEFGADQNVWNVDRILRLPGTLNLKNQARPLEVTCIFADPTAFVRRSDVQQIEAFAVPEQQTYSSAQEINPQDRTAILEKWTELGNGTQEGPGRHFLALEVAGWLKSNNWPETATVGLVAELAREAGDDETEDRVRAVRDTYRREDAARGFHGLKNDFGLDLVGLEIVSNYSVPIKHVQDSGAGVITSKRAKPNKNPTYADYRDTYLEHLAEAGEFIAYNEKQATWWRYANGVHLEMNLDQVRRLVDTLLENTGYDNLTGGALDNVLAKISRADGIWRGGSELGPRELNCANGILNLETKTLSPHTPDRFITMQTPALWNPDAECPTWFEFLNNTLETDDQATLAQFFGYCLTGDTNYQAALMMIGKGGTGKGTTVSVLQRLLGGDAPQSLAASMSLESLKDGTPMLEALVNKRLLTVSETAKDVDWLAFKRVTGEDRVLINPKFRPAYSARLGCKIIIMSNVIPRLGDDAANGSLTRRFVPLEFNRVPPERDESLLERLTTPDELSGILNWAVEWLHNLWRDGGFYASSTGLSKRIVEESNRTIAFLEEQCTRCDLSDGTGSMELYQAYRTWCEATGYRTVAIEEFSRRLEAAGEHLSWPLERKSSRLFGPKKRIVSGVKLGTNL